MKNRTSVPAVEFILCYAAPKLLQLKHKHPELERYLEAEQGKMSPQPTNPSYYGRLSSLYNGLEASLIDNLEHAVFLSNVRSFD